MKRSLFTTEEVAAAYKQSAGNYYHMARTLSDMGRGVVSGQLARWWALMLEPDEIVENVEHTPDSFRELARSRAAHVSNLKLARDNRHILDKVATREEFTLGLQQAIDTLAVRPAIPMGQCTYHPDKTRLTAEIVVSDWQIGKLAPEYNTQIALARMREMGRAATNQILGKIQAGYHVERIVLAIIGDIIESDKKHANSARATDTGTAEQVYDAIVGLFTLLLEPIASLGIPTHVVCVTGNHDHDGHGLNMFRPGREHLSYPLYKSLEYFSQRLGLHHLSFQVEDGVFGHTDIYQNTVVYEHGVGVSIGEQQLRTQKAKRADQLGKHVTYFRMGDKHTVSTFNAGQLVVNGAFFAPDSTGVEYSAIVGYSSVPAQWMAFHTPRADRRLTLYDQFVIQLGHVK
jgi:hypothetical protein